MAQGVPWWQAEFNHRPWWMNILLVLCLLLIIGIPVELLIRPVADDVEVWFGIEFTGWVAKVMAMLHWAIYVAGAWGFWKMRTWMWPWASVYVAQVALAHLVWSEWSTRGHGWPIGLLQAAAISLVAVALWRARPLFQGSVAAK